MRRPLRLTLVVVGVALVIGSVVWTVLRTVNRADDVRRLGPAVTSEDVRALGPDLNPLLIGTSLAGLALTAFGAWPRRRRADATTS